MSLGFGATTLLGANTVPILRGFCEDLGAAGLDFGFDAQARDRERLAQIKAGNVDLVWACGLLTTELIAAGHALEIVAAPVFAQESQPVYRSVIVARTDSGYKSLVDALSGRLAVNDYGSWSGWHGLLAHLDMLDLPPGSEPGATTRAAIESGSHRASIDAVRNGDADVAAIDSSIWNDLKRNDTSFADFEVLGVTGDWPAPPFSVRSTLAEPARRQVEAVLLANPAIAWARAPDYDSMLEFARGDDLQTGEYAQWTKGFISVPEPEIVT